MANEYAVNQADLKAVADAIRTKGGTNDALTFPDGFVDAVGAIKAGSSEGNTSEVLYTAEITEPVSAIRINIPDEWKQDYILICVPDIEMSAVEWLCCGIVGGNRKYIGTGGSIGFTKYTARHTDEICVFTNGYSYFRDSLSVLKEMVAADANEILFTPYYEANTFKVGTIKILGVKLP